MTKRGAAVLQPATQQPASSTTKHDLQVGWKTDWLKGLNLVTGVNKLFGKELPICLTCSLNGYEAPTYDLMGSSSTCARCCASEMDLTD